MTDAIEAQASLEETLKGEILRMYQEVADNPGATFHFYHGREAAEMFGYDPGELDDAPPGAVASFAPMRAQIGISVRNVSAIRSFLRFSCKRPENGRAPARRTRILAIY